MAIEFSVEFPLRVVVYPAPDMPGTWIAHGLETDIVTQGDSVDDAVAMMADAVMSLGSYNLKVYPGTLPITLRPAPKEVWDLIGEAVPQRIWARVAIHGKGTRRAAASPTGWPIYPFVSDHAPAQVNAR
jgi:hypothetical protein